MGPGGVLQGKLAFTCALCRSVVLAHVMYIPRPQAGHVEALPLCSSDILTTGQRSLGPSPCFEAHHVLRLAARGLFHGAFLRCCGELEGEEGVHNALEGGCGWRA